ncbi:MAG: co-chaperone GroES [Endozoicomonadaceae bacterium]|nr:co-chaperone GroES [Endozoicomonadaceae bacterium]MCY4328623.1 co-chaperone GroES [Endozoicomonadaceae bacterium]
MKLRPLGKRVLIRRQPKETVSSGGIVLPGSGEETNRGEVVAVGPGTRLENGETDTVSLNIGDKVLFGGYHGEANKIKIDGVEHVLMSESDILAVVESE